MENSHDNRIQNLQALRGIAVILVIAVHLQGNEGKYGHGYTILPDFLTIGHSGVDLFFVISGFVMVAITRGCFRKRDAIYRFLYHRVTRIYPTYWLYSFLMLVIYLVQREMSSVRVVDVTASFLLLPQSQLPLLVVGWTLVHEIYFYLVFTLLLIFHQRWLFPLLLAWGITSTSGQLIPSENPTIQLITNPLTWEFIFGSLIALIYFAGKSPFKLAKYLGWSFLILSFAWWLLAYRICIQLELPPESSDWLRLIVFGLPAAFLVYSVVVLEKYLNWRLPSCLILIGDASFSIYLSHLLVIATIGRVWEKFGMVGLWENGTVLMTMVISTLAIGIASFRLIERPLLKFSRIFEF